MVDLKEACGVFGVILSPEADLEGAELTYLGLQALQHRGQESAGILAARAGGRHLCHKGMGLLSQAIDPAALDELTGQIHLGHVRYSTTGDSALCNAQPIGYVTPSGDCVALAHNGNLVNSAALAGRWADLESSSDSELLLRALAESLTDKLSTFSPQELSTGFAGALSGIAGAYSLALALGEQYLVAIRDQNGIKPLCLGSLHSLEGNLIGYSIASESCALDAIGARFVREIPPGEILLIDRELQLFSQVLGSAKSHLCLFELIYFARPDSRLLDLTVMDYRERCGRRLAQLFPPPEGVELVIGVPDSGLPAALGYAQETGLPLANGIVKNSYIGRTFINPKQSARKLSIRLKLSPVASQVKGKSVILVDDSIVRGNTPRELVRLLRKCGAREIHLRISSPPIVWGCHYGIAFKNEELIARRHDSDLLAMAADLGADTLEYLPLQEALSEAQQDERVFCSACLDGDYPISIV